MDTAVGDADKKLNPIARMRLNAELMGLVRQKAALSPSEPMAALKAARIAANIVTTLGKLGIDLAAKKREAEAFVLDGGPEPVPEPRTVTAKFFDFDPTRKHSERKKDNAAALELLRRLDAGELSEPLTDEQKQVLARYSGTGGNLVGADGKKGSAYEYYTPKPIAAGCWDLLVAMGFKGGKVGDPCAGVGIFGATAPANAAMETVELNETSGRINQLVNGGPGYSAVVAPFETVASRTPDEIWDAVITNVPFGGVHDRGSNRKIDPKYSDQPLETYFILRSLEKLKPGGLAAFIVPPRVVSAKGGREEQLRIAASYLAEFRGAYRLPNSVFGTADADTITDVIVFRKFGRDTLRKIEELREQNPQVLVEAGVQWPEFIGGMYFQGEGKRFVLGEFQAKDPNKFRDVDRVISDQSVANVAKLLRKFPDSRIDWKLLNATESEPLSYNEGDTITMAGQTLEMRGGTWVALGRAPEDDRYDALGQVLATPAVAVVNKVTWTQANDYVLHLRQRSMELELPMWLRDAHRDMTRLDAGEQAKYWNAVTAGLAAIEVMRQHADEPAFNYLETYPAISEALQAAAPTARKPASKLGRESKAALQKVGIVYDRRSGFSALWKGEGAVAVAQKDRDEEAQVEAVKYETQGLSIDVAKLREIYGAEFDPLQDDAWCVNGDGSKATKADDYYTGNLAAFLARIDAEIAQAGEPLKSKLLRQRDLAAERVARVDPSHLRFNLFTPFATIEEKAEFLRRFMHPSFVIAYDDEGGKYILCDINPKTEHERQLKRFAEYLKKGNLSTRTKEEEAAANPNLDAQRRAMLREMAIQANAQFDQWVKSNPLVMDRLRQTANDPEKLYFIETEDTGALKIDGLHPDFKPHGYQRAFVRRQGRSFGGINGFDVGLGKTATALAAALYVQNIGVKKKTAFVVPNSVLSNWRKEALLGNYKPGHPQYRPPVYGPEVASDCLFVGLDVAADGTAKVDPANYARDLNRVLENKHSKIFMTLEAFKLIPLRDETVERYQVYLQSVDKSFADSERKADSERAESKVSEATTGTGEKSSAIPFFEDMGIDSLVGDELHLYKNSKNTVEFSGAKFLSVAEASQRGLDVQIKAWFVRGLSPLGDGVLGLTATPITNSPLEIYSMLCLAVGEKRVHDLCLGAEGADEFMNVMCHIEEDEELSIDGKLKPYRVFRGLQNVDLLRNAIATVMTIKTAADVKDGGDDLKLPDAPEHHARVALQPKAAAMLQEYKLAYRGARESLKSNGEPTEEELAALARVSERFGEPVELIAHPFNLINKMTLLIADPELDERATFYDVHTSQADLAQTVCGQFNALGKIEARALAGPWTLPEAVAGIKTVRDGDNEVKLVKIKVMARLVKGRVVLDTMDTNLQGEFEKLAGKAGLDLDCSIPPKLAALLENVRKEEANPRSASGRVKQIIFCDVLPLHNKIKRLLTKHAGVAATAIVLVSGQTMKNAEMIQGVQDGFNAEGEENRYRYVIANEKAEVGINLQKGTQAIHHLTIGWTPDSTVQRNGRGVRQGNTTSRVNVYHYDADGTFDEYKRTLTSKKADWIGAVMDKQGGNDVAIAGGLTAEEYDDLINAVGDEGAMQAIRARAEAKEKLARAETARARQVVNFKTVRSQQEFLKKYPDAKAWLVEKGMQLYDLRQSIYAMDERVRSGKLSARAQISMETRLAEARARAEGLARELTASGTYKRFTYDSYSRTQKEVEATIDDVLRDDSHFKSAAKIRESIESSLKWKAQVVAGSEIEQDWQSEASAAKGMVGEALKDFERLAKEAPGTYPPKMVEAISAGDATVIDGKLFAKGMFARNRAGQLTIVASTTTLSAVRSDGHVAQVQLADAVTHGWTFIMFGTPEYEQAVLEAARIDDSVAEIAKDQRANLFSSISADVAKARRGITLVRYQARYARLPAPHFPYPIDPSAPGLSPALKAVAEKQKEVIHNWERGAYGYHTILASAVHDMHESSNTADGERLATLIAYARGNSLTLNYADMQHVLGRTGVAYELMERGRWPAEQRAYFDAAQDVEALDAMARRVLVEGLDFIDVASLPDTMDAMDFFPVSLRVAYNMRAQALKAAAIRAAQANRPVAEVVQEVQVQAAQATEVAAGVGASSKGLIGLKGDTKPNKEKIKAAAKAVGGYARWNGDKVQWDVPAATWPYIVQTDPALAQVLQVVPA